MTRNRQKTDHFKELTWNDLTVWAGNKIVSRGKDYQKNGYVKDLACTNDGGLVAWVKGTTRYATYVFFEDGELESDCTCPYWDTCKHAVAVVLEYLSGLKEKGKFPKAAEKDRRLKMLEEFLDDDSWFDKEDHVHDDFKDIYHQEHPKYNDSFLEPFIKKHTKAKLIELVKELAGQYPMIMAHLKDQSNLSIGEISDTAASIREEIQQLGSEPGWQNYWRGEGYTPDYSRVKQRLEALLDKGYADEVLCLGEELLEAGIRQVEMSNDEGETMEEIASCMDMVFRALPKSSLSIADQMLWAVDRELEDPWTLCEGVEVFWKREKTKGNWNILVDKLTERLQRFSKTKGDNYERDRLTDWIITALKNAGRKDEIVTLCENEAAKTNSYVRLVRILMQDKQWEAAEQWIRKGISTTDKKWPGIAAQLRESLREIREKQGNWLQVAALRADDFFSEPSLNTYQVLEKAAKKAKIWMKMKPIAINYLQTGNLLQFDLSWPLPETGIPKTERRRAHEFPRIGALVDIAIAEKRPKDILHWYDLGKNRQFGGWWGEHREDKIAAALATDYPDKAVDVWKRLSENLIAQVKPKAYEKAAIYLRKVQRVLKKQKKDKEWQKYIVTLRQKHVRKKRLLAILDGLDAKPILGES